MPIPRLSLEGRSAPVHGVRVQPPGTGAPCDKCHGPTSKWNTHGRCYACCLRVGYPEDDTDAPVKQDGRRKPHPHPGCRCVPDSYPDPNRHLKTRAQYVIDVICPDCGAPRAVGTKEQPCATDYEVRCMKCTASRNARTMNRKRAR